MPRVFLWGLLVGLIALQPLSTDMYLPALPSLVKTFGTTEALIQWTLSAFLIGVAMAQLFYGPLSDRYGRKPVLQFGIAIYLIGSLACLFSPTIETLIGARFVQAVGCCAAATIARAAVRDLFGPERAARALAYLGAAMGLIPALAPIVGGYLLVAFDWRAIFVVLSGVGAFTLLILFTVFEETNKTPNLDALDRRIMLANYREMLGQRSFLGFTCAVALSIGGLVMFLSGSPYVFIKQLGVPADIYGYYFATMALSYSAGTICAARLTMKLGIERMVMIGTTISALGGLAQAALAWAGVETVGAVLVPQGLYMIGLGFTLPNALAGAIGPYATRAGAASALVGFIQLSIAAAISIGVAYLFGWTQLTMATGMALMAGSGLIAFYALGWRARDRMVIPPRDAAIEPAYTVNRRPG